MSLRSKAATRRSTSSPSSLARIPPALSSRPRDARDVGPRAERAAAGQLVDYAFTPRTLLLRDFKQEMPEADVLLMTATDRTRYFGKSRSERFKEWLEHKST